MKRILNLLLVMAALLGGAATTHGQWITQSMNLKAGWNAVFLNVDASHQTLEQMFGDTSTPIQEVWLWAPSPGTLEFIDSPQQPTTGGSQWITWQRAAGLSSTLTKLVPNAAYLIRVDSDYTWNLKGKPVPFKYNWTTTGLNFIGFPSTTAVNPPTFDTFLNAIPEVKRVAEIFYYPGGDLGEFNPSRVFALRNQRVQRGQAFWIRSQGVFNRYFAPFEVDLPSTEGVHFHDSLSQNRILIRNIHPTAITVRLSLVPSEAPPVGQTSIVDLPPMLVRGALNTTNLTYDYSVLNGSSKTFTLAAQGQIGSEIEVVLGVNRSQINGNPGDLYAGILRFEDSLNFSQIDIPTSAEAGSTSGLWVGNATVGQVQHYLKAYQKDGDGNLQQDASGKYISTSTNSSLGGVARNFPLRLILHNDDSGKVTLLQRVFYGSHSGTNAIVIRESLLDQDKLASARRISAIHLPWTEQNTSWPCSGQLRQGASLYARVELPHDAQASNPFLHTYHPDHDNLDASFSQNLPAGFESYFVRRDVQLTITPPADNFTSLTSGNQTLVGQYDETVTFFGKGSESREFKTRGDFVLNRLNSIAALTME